VSDKDVVLDGYAFADKGMTGDLAAFADISVLLYLDKGSNLRLVSDLTAVEVNELGKAHVPSQLDVWSDA
jgi:homogentisate 1,2-dioxygenase